MPRVFTNIPPEELQMKIIRARENIRNKVSREIRCPYCKRIAFTVYADSTGFVKTKCEKCKHDVLIDLVNMRRMNRKQ